MQSEILEHLRGQRQKVVVHNFFRIKTTDDGIGICWHSIFINNT